MCIYKCRVEAGVFTMLMYLFISVQCLHCSMRFIKNPRSVTIVAKVLLLGVFKNYYLTFFSCFYFGKAF